MKIVFMIDRENFNSYAPKMPDDWEIIHLGYESVSDEAIIATDADALVIDPMAPLSAEVIAKMQNLKIIHSLGVGFNLIDLEAAKAANIYVCNNAGVNAGAVAEQTILLILAVLRNYHEAEAMTYAARQGEYKNTCFGNALTELASCRVGLIGFGAIGKAVALRLAGFECETWYYKPSPLREESIYNAESHSMEEILKKCDIISLHAPVTQETINLINEENLALMKPGAILINSSRGELVDQKAVCKALIDGRLAGFGADTLYPEPVQQDNPIINLPEEIRNRIALSPHIAGITTGTMHRSYEWTISNITDVFEGERPKNIVNGI